MLTGRLGLWDFLRDEVPTYKNLTIEFLSSYEFDRGTRVLSFNLGGYYHTMNTHELMVGLGLLSENVDQMRPILQFFHDMNENHFRSLTCQDGILGPQRVKNILHPTIWYLQRVISHTLFARGETASVFNLGDMLYVCCMLRRNNEEMDYMPHLGYFLAKHMHNVATNRQPGGTIRIGGIITKIANFLRVPTGTDIVQGPTIIDIPCLQRARLIKWDDYQECFVNLGPGTLQHRLPLTTDIDSLNQATWKIVDEPLEPQEYPINQPPQAAPQPAAQPQEGPTNQQLWDFMQTMQGSITDMANSMNSMRLHFDNRLDHFDNRLNEMEGEISTAGYYSREAAMHNNPDFDEEPPTPPHVRRAVQRREREMARKAATDQESHDMDADNQ